MKKIVVAASLASVACIIWFFYLLIGPDNSETMIVSLNKCNENIGTIVCGRKYEIRVTSRTAEKICTNSFGFNKGTNTELMHSDGCYESNGDHVKIFGALFHINRQTGDIIFTSSAQIVGRMETP